MFLIPSFLVLKKKQLFCDMFLLGSLKPEASLSLPLNCSPSFAYLQSSMALLMASLSSLESTAGVDRSQKRGPYVVCLTRWSRKAKTATTKVPSDSIVRV
jgi:hypothetical protein